jgi:hypothetical protein
MWHKTTTIKIKNYDVDVISYYDVDDNGHGKICFRAMLNEYFMTFELLIDERDAERDLAYSLIENFPLKTLRDKMLQLAYDSGALG